MRKYAYWIVVTNAQQSSSNNSVWWAVALAKPDVL